jgi:hypothetical protein
MKHTKGPWKIVNWDSSSQIRDDNNNEIALLRNSSGDANNIALPDESTISNAKLIAAAPEMLQCIKEMNTLLAILTEKEIGSTIAQELINRIEG